MFDESDQVSIEWCVDYLIIADDIDDLTVNLYDFLTDFLELTKEQSNIIMTYLDDSDISEFGGNIMCSWFNRSKYNPYINRAVMPHRRRKIMEWISTYEV